MTDLIAIDTETSGLNPATHFLLALGAVTATGATFYRLILPPRTWLGTRKKVGARAIAVNGYNLADWKKRGAVEASDAARSFALWLGQVAKEGARRPLAHNAGFDRAFLDAFSEKTNTHFPLNHRWECSMAALSFAQRAGIVRPGPASLDVTKLTRKSGQERPTVHDALADAKVSLHGYAHLLNLSKKERTPAP
jgi:DNA polymerase III epsilon subunit-like protein